MRNVLSTDIMFFMYVLAGSKREDSKMLLYKMKDKVYFEFIQVAMANRKSLTVSVSDADWHRLFDFCKKQALVGVGFTAVEKLHTLGMECPANLRMQWMALALQIEKKIESVH